MSKNGEMQDEGYLIGSPSRNDESEEDPAENLRNSYNQYVNQLPKTEGHIGEDKSDESDCQDIVRNRPTKGTDIDDE